MNESERAMSSEPSPISDAMLRLDFDALSAFLDEVFPAAQCAFGRLVLVEPGHTQVRLEPTPAMLRPGNIVSGPTLMGMADVAAYTVILAHIGPVAMTVTNSVNISFLRACSLAPVVADARLLKLGRKLAVTDIRLWQDHEARLVAQAIVSYVLP